MDTQYRELRKDDGPSSIPKKGFFSLLWIGANPGVAYLRTLQTHDEGLICHLTKAGTGFPASDRQGSYTGGQSFLRRVRSKVEGLDRV